MYRLLLALLFLLTIPSTLHAVPSKIPEELQPWIPWVLYKQEEKICTINGGKGPLRYCSWPSKLILKADHEGAAFAQDYLIETRTLVPLPGSPPFWPQNVTSNGTPLAMSKKGSQPAVWLNPGKHTIKGHFQWNSLPESLFIPPETGLLTLFLHGQQVPVIQLDTKGRLWFKQQKRQAKAEEESLSLQVYRKIEDGIPLIQHLKLILTVSGSPRQATLGLKIQEVGRDLESRYKGRKWGGIFRPPLVSRSLPTSCPCTWTPPSPSALIKRTGWNFRYAPDSGSSPFV